MLGSDFPESVKRFRTDITDYQRLKDDIDFLKPKAIVNCANVGTFDSEVDPQRAYLVHVAGSTNLAELCSKLGIKLIQISTVYSGSDGVYGKTKEIAEDCVLGINSWFAVVRLPWLFGQKNDKHFNSYVIRSLRAGEKIDIYDEVGMPTFTRDVADYILLHGIGITGKVDVMNDGVASRFLWASEIARRLGFSETLLEERNKRSQLVLHQGGKQIELRSWTKALGDCLDGLR